MYSMDSLLKLSDQLGKDLFGLEPEVMFVVFFHCD